MLNARFGLGKVSSKKHEFQKVKLAKENKGDGWQGGESRENVWL